MRKLVLVLAALSVAIVPAAPALAHHGRGGGTGDVILGALGGTALGLGIGSMVNRPRVAPPVYQGGYQAGYEQPAYQPQYQQQAYQPQYQPEPARNVDLRPSLRPAPGGIACLRWDGRGYVPFAC